MGLKCNAMIKSNLITSKTQYRIQYSYFGWLQVICLTCHEQYHCSLVSCRRQTFCFLFFLVSPDFALGTLFSLFELIELTEENRGKKRRNYPIQLTARTENPMNLTSPPFGLLVWCAWVIVPKPHVSGSRAGEREENKRG